MQRGSTMFLRVAILFVGLAVLAVCTLALPEGLREGSDAGFGPIFWLMYLTAVPFFAALYQTLKLLSYIDLNRAFSVASVTALKHIKYCAFAVSALYALGMPYIYIMAEQEDAPGVLVIGLVFAGTSLMIAVFAAVLEKLLQSAIAMKSENDLTV